MISVPASLQTQLEAGAPTLCWCWRVAQVSQTYGPGQLASCPLQD